MSVSHLQTAEWGGQAALSRRGAAVAEDPLSDSEACRLPLLTVPPPVTAQLGENSRERRVCQTLNPAAVAFSAREHTQPGGSVNWKALAGEAPRINTPHVCARAQFY